MIMNKDEILLYFFSTGTTVSTAKPLPQKTCVTYFRSSFPSLGLKGNMKSAQPRPGQALSLSVRMVNKNQAHDGKHAFDRIQILDLSSTHICIFQFGFDLDQNLEIFINLNPSTFKQAYLDKYLDLDQKSHSFKISQRDLYERAVVKTRETRLRGLRLKRILIQRSRSRSFGIQVFIIKAYLDQIQIKENPDIFKKMFLKPFRVKTQTSLKGSDRLAILLHLDFYHNKF